MPTAALLIDRECNLGQPTARGAAFSSGLEACGFRVIEEPVPQPSPQDVLVIWNRMQRSEAFARRYELHGARVIVAENGYLGREWRGRVWYALSLWHHNGMGQWPDGGPERWESWSVPLEPWREGGEEIVILAQRGIGHPSVAQPRGWPEQAAAKLRKSGRRVRIRVHPGERNMARATPLDVELAKAFAVATWGSGAALKAILMGVPVFYAFPHWIGGLAAKFGFDELEPFRGDRLPMLRRLAWAQWNLDEIRNGEAFRWLLR